MTDQLHRELWTSWASLLRSYSAAHGLGSDSHAVVEVSEDRITVRYGMRWVSFTATAFEKSDESPVPFRLTEDGKAVLGEQEEEMDIAAEQVARELILGN